ncbi:hypothetical protein EJ04DRAFT_116944 [Polyplosphaeria fusca]|uniref:Uncharacterized protein n=1 Tax=Polyplosphaeria fusca TaxID=682080 RepID=A0A9P4R8W0_9PLEO|nr:hypothetical protein EJ04DRAFT_116944 [Polyplosphaeria fusca]
MFQCLVGRGRLNPCVGGPMCGFDSLDRGRMRCCGSRPALRSGTGTPAFRSASPRSIHMASTQPLLQRFCHGDGQKLGASRYQAGGTPPDASYCSKRPPPCCHGATSGQRRDMKLFSSSAGWMHVW